MELEHKGLSPHVALAIQAIGAYVREGRVIAPPKDIPAELGEPGAAFVCIKKHGELRGCIGTIEPMQTSLAREIIENAISAATRDFRFLPLDPSEIEHLTCSVDILTIPERIDDASLLDPSRYGVIVESGGRRGLLLPDLEGVDTVEDQIVIASRKAMIRPGEPIKLSRFEVRRYY